MRLRANPWGFQIPKKALEKLQYIIINKLEKTKNHIPITLVEKIQNSKNQKNKRKKNNQNLKKKPKKYGIQKVKICNNNNFHMLNIYSKLPI